MKKRKKPFTKPTLPAVLRSDTEVVTPPSDVPRITTDTVAAHREEVIGGARKYILRLGHTKHKIVSITASLLVLTFVVFLTYTVVALYRFQTTSTFMYRVTQVLPLPVAKAGSDLVSYESYLFEIRRYTHYYENKLNLDFNSPQGEQQLVAFKKQALEKVINDAYVKKIAKEKGISVSDKELDEQLNLLRTQNRLGESNEVFEDVLRDYWGWSVRDFRRYLKDQILSQKVAATLDTETNQRAQSALEELRSGQDFAKVAAKYSDDAATKGDGGGIGVVGRNDRDVPPKVIDVLYRLDKGQSSEVINAGYTLVIVKYLEQTEDGDRRAAHITFNFKDIADQLNALKEQQPTRAYINL
jgi:parvulin-like peptidyl-prolyl isomerase